VTTFATADPIAAVVAYLAADTAVTTALGGTGHVGGYNTPPYPRLAVTDLDGDDRDLRWITVPVLQLELLGDLDGTPGKPALRAALYVALDALRRIPDAGGSTGGVVITRAESASGARWAPLPPNNQARYVASVRLYVHPAP
jgi:hypothetical protein